MRTLIAASLAVLAIAVGLGSGKARAQEPAITYLPFACLTANAAIAVLVAPEGPEFDAVMGKALATFQCHFFASPLPTICDDEPVEFDPPDGGLVIRQRTLDETHTLLYGIRLSETAADRIEYCGGTGRIRHSA